MERLRPGRMVEGGREAEAERVAKRFEKGNKLPVYCAPETETLWCSPTKQGSIGDYITAAVFFILGIVVLRAGSVHMKKKKKRAK